MQHNSSHSLQDIDKEYYLQTFRRFPLVLERGKGSKVWDIDGNEYIDALAGIAVNNLGHCHPKIVKAIQEQAEKLIHISNFYLSEPQALLARKLVELSGLGRAFFSNSGAEAVEGALKIARKYGHTKGKDGTVISMKNCFHGRTFATIATGKKEMQNGFEPIPSGFLQIPFNDIEAVEKALADHPNAAAIIIEPIQGEGGINVAGYEYLSQLRSICNEKDVVLIFDEIQSGVGRTGKWFAKDHYGVQPDIMTLAKGLGGGIPVGAILSNQKVSSAIEYGDHGTTFGGNPLATAVALAVLSAIEEENLIKAAEEKGFWLIQAIADMDEPSVRRVKGRGLMIGIEFDFETKPLVLEMMNNGVLANATAGNILRLVPPLNIRYDQLETVIKVLKKSLNSIKTVNA